MSSPSERLQQLVKTDRLPHSLLLSGAPIETQKGVDALLETLFEKASAKQLLKYKKGSHPDVHILKPEGKGGLHSMHALRTMQEQCSLVPLEGPKKCFILYEAERMLPTSSNALLKTFEEPQAKTLILLVTQYPERLLPTVRSRCQTYTFPSAQESEEPLFDLLLPFLRGQRQREIATEIEKELDGERTTFVKEKMGALSKEITGLQKETLLKEIEGEATLHYQRRAFTLLEGALKIYRDLYIYHLGLSKEYLFYPTLFDAIQSIAPKPLEQVEASIKEGKVAIQRGIKLSAALQHVALSLGCVA
jgi:DNA polymerase III subunit delta'